MPRHFDHIDLRVPKLADVTAFYGALLPVLGFSSRVAMEGWFQFEAADRGITEFFGITESAAHIANENRIAFWAESPADVDRLAQVVTRAGARSIEGPMQYITLFSLKILAAIAWRSAIAPGMRLKPSNPYEGSQMR